MRHQTSVPSIILSKVFRVTEATADFQFSVTFIAVVKHE